MRFIVVRHAESVWNAIGRIQGRAPCEGLSALGRQQAIDLAARLSTAVPADEIWSSDSERAAETANAIGARLGLRVRYSPLLREVDAGILTGATHSWAAVHHPRAYAVWIKRGDLDEIDRAETGSELQSRAVAFLAGWARFRDERTRIIVSHAAYIRCLVNTVRARPRTTPVPVGHDAIHELDDVWSRLPVAWLSRGGQLPVGRVRTRDGDYVLKVLKRGDGPLAAARLSILGRVHEAMCGRRMRPCFGPDAADPGLIVSSRPWIEGEHRFGLLDGRELVQMAQMLAKLHSSLRELSRHADVGSIQSASCFLGRHMDSLEETDRNKALQLLAQTRTALDDRHRAVIVDADVHRENILFDGEKAHKIDFDSLCAGPGELQLASTLVGSFLIEGSTFESIAALIDTIHPFEFDRDLVRRLMALRALKGLAYFRAKRSGSTVDGYMAKYRACLRHLDR